MMTHLQQNHPEGEGQTAADLAWYGLKNVFKDSVDKAYRLVYEETPDHVILVAANRHGKIVIDGIPHPFVPNSAHLVLPGQRVETVYLADGEQIIYRIHIGIIPYEGQKVSSEHLLTELGRPITFPDAQVQQLCEKIVCYWHTGDSTDRFASQAGFQDLLHLLFKKQNQHENALERARKYMLHHYQDTITVDDLADEAGMSRYYFMRSFKEKFGQSSMDYLAEIRTNEAKRLMEAGQPLKDIALLAGFKDQHYFSSQFKKQVGLPPRTYIANRKCKTAAYSWPNIGHLLTLQIIPFAAPIDQFWTDDYRRKYRYDVKVALSHDYDFNLKALMRARPDRIVALDEMIPEEEKEKLRHIAPVLFLSWHGEDWRQHLRRTARFLDRENESERWLLRYEEKVETVLHYIPHSFQQGKLIALSVSPRGIQIWGRRAGTVFYDDLKIAAASGVDQIEFTRYVEAEQLAAFDADVIIVSVMKDHHSLMVWERLQHAESWKQLHAVRNRQVYLTQGGHWLSEPILEHTANRHELLLQEVNLLFSAR
ncbi:helix-turn-helix domain-containing protein [Paenibacillus marchantiae]|nr:helix-turn-helix domain-containing protein [Paenibacillus marchantiae]WDQ31425.1 helix-turn-helix domain-containing protein [Paenibacillus marchantiae]